MFRDALFLSRLKQVYKHLAYKSKTRMECFLAARLTQFNFIAHKADIINSAN